LVKQLLWATVAIGLTGCVTPQTNTFVTPSGAQAQTTKCSQSPQGCFQTATNTCRGSYRVLDSYSKAGGLLADVLPGPVTWYYMTYECGRSDGSFPQFALRGAAPSMPSPPVVVTAPQPRQSVTCTTFGNMTTCR